MNNPENNKWLDKALSNTIGSEKTKPDFEQWKEKHQQAVQMLTSRASDATVSKRPLNIGNIIMKNPIIKFAAAAVITIALVGMFQLWNSSSNKAYAQTALQFRNARTLIFTMYLPNEEIITPNQIQMVFKEPGLMRTEMPGGYVTVADWAQGKAISLLPTRSQYVEMTMDDLTDDPAQQQFHAIEELRSLPQKADEYLGVIENDGRELEGFLVRQNHTIQKVWLDSQTLEPVMIETEFINAPGMNLVMMDFQFDVDLDNSLFSIMPPLGYSKLDVQINASQVSEEDLISYLQMWAGWTKDNSFPPSFNPIELQKIAMEMEQQGRFDKGSSEESYEEGMTEALLMTRGIMFVMQLPSDSNWRYAGENVTLGDAKMPIFWYRPNGSELYRVIFGDLHVEIVAEQYLP